MADEPAGERTEQASPRKREDARRRGQVALSPDLTAAVALLGAFGAYTTLATGLGPLALSTMARGVTLAPRAELDIDAALALFGNAATTAVRLAAPLVGATALVGLAVQVFQTRFMMSPGTLKPDWKRVSPSSNLGAIFGGRGLLQLVKAIAKLAAVAGAVGVTIQAAWPRLIDAPNGLAAWSIAEDVALGIWLRVGAWYLALAALDYGYQWWRHEKQLRMTTQEARQETKDTEGNPALRGRLRSLHRRYAARRMLADVRRADVVLRNPTHVAVALAYDRGRMAAPRVLAKGERLLALRIIEAARAAGVPVVENPPLARAIHAAVEIGREIPVELYRAVAEVLAYVYALGTRGTRA